MSGGVITFGDPLNGDAIGDPAPFHADHDVANGLLSPTIQLRSSNGSYPNTIGITAPTNPGDAIASANMMIDYDLYAHQATSTAPPAGPGITYRCLVQSYPLRSS